MKISLGQQLVISWLVNNKIANIIILISRYEEYKMLDILATLFKRFINKWQQKQGTTTAFLQLCKTNVKYVWKCWFSSKVIKGFNTNALLDILYSRQLKGEVIIQTNGNLIAISTFFPIFNKILKPTMIHSLCILSSTGLQCQYFGNNWMVLYQH